MTAKKGNRNAFKHGLYAKHYTPDDTVELGHMPADELFMELAAMRIVADRAMNLYESCEEVQDMTRILTVMIQALEAASSIVEKIVFLAGKAPVMQDLWEAMRVLNKAEGWDHGI